MAQLNFAVRHNTGLATGLKTAEGAPAVRINKVQQLKRLLNACMLWEDNFYSNGQDVATLMRELVREVPAATCAQLAIAAREEQKLRHAPLLIVYEMTLASKQHKELVGETLARVIQRPDEITEFVAMYWKLGGGKRPLSNQVKKGLAAAFNKFTEYQLAKYNRDKDIKLADVLALVHAKPKDKETGLLFAKLANKDHLPKKTKSAQFPVANTYRALNKEFVGLATPDTWEVALSGGADKKETFERLIREDKLGGLAMIRNLRNMQEAGVSDAVIKQGLAQMNTERVLPFRFISAAKYAPKFESHLEGAMFKCLEGHEKLPGKTVLLVDVSGSMDASVSRKSDLQRVDAGAALAMLLREVCEDVVIYTFSEREVLVPTRRGFALAEAIKGSQQHGGTYLGRSAKAVSAREYDADRVIVITDEQSHDHVGNPFAATNAKAYMLNVASERNGVGYKNGWSHIDGWSESCIDYIVAEEGFGSSRD
jgi:60 kDa SS-A/Ro ribonucleoprotein